MNGGLFQYLGGNDDSTSGDDPPNGRRTSLFDRHRTDRASVNGKVRYVLLGMMSVIGTSIVATVVL